MLKDCGQRWWKEAKFGMFIHWGLYSALAGEWKGKRTHHIGEWIMKDENIPVTEYEALAKQFNPVSFDAAEWVGLAKEAGMKYLVFTAKHHDGFAMYRSKSSGYNIVDATDFKRDPMEELASACAKAGIKMCFYYSQAQDWHDPDGYGYGPVPDDRKDFTRYFEEKCKPQVRELLTQYGEIGIVWFDTPLITPPEKSRELAALVKSIQPDCLINGRIGNEAGDYMSTGDNKLPLLPYFGDWEVPATLNDTWGYKYFDDNWKSPEQVLRLLVKINGKGGNYLLNVGPDAKGVIPKQSRDILKKVGSWVSANGESIYATQAVPVYPYELENHMFTYKPGKLFVHVFNQSRRVEIHCIANRVRRAYSLPTGNDIVFIQKYFPSQKHHRIIIDLPDIPADPMDYVICMEMDPGDGGLVFDSLENL